ncbi:hypothetical protein QJS10_CPB18g01782 [Acorus calamus]|uniref:CBS domain-containing protein n=1 Tax=Acorus calamus TaxID=4465 RepID=A0AAV9CRF0_ACOCL|nr:hypothetical protein QJS10_CPB18g01782 [Acorus calamus]
MASVSPQCFAHPPYTTHRSPSRIATSISPLHVLTKTLISSDLGLLFSEEIKRTRSLRSYASVDNRVELDDNPEGIISGEWPDNFSLLSYEDLRAYLEPQIFTEQIQPTTVLGEVMSTPVQTATVDQTLEEIVHFFEVVSGLPVVDNELRCIGIVTKTDVSRASNGLKSTVGEVMSSPAITLSPNKTVMDAAALMLKEKINRIPILSQEGGVIGIVTGTDIFNALEGPHV